MFEALLIADSRAWGFDRYQNQPTDYSLNYIVKRGARINDLKSETKRWIRNVGNDRVIFVKIALGINDLLTFKHNHVEKTIVNSSTTAPVVLEKLIAFRQSILNECPRAVVGFVTIPTVSFEKYQYTKCIQTTILSNTQLAHEQQELDRKLDWINSKLVRENDLTTHVFSVSWHTSIRRSSLVRRRNGTHRRVIKSQCKHLYDGLHGDQELKKSGLQT